MRVYPIDSAVQITLPFHLSSDIIASTDMYVTPNANQLLFFHQNHTSYYNPY